MIIAAVIKLMGCVRFIGRCVSECQFWAAARPHGGETELPRIAAEDTAGLRRMESAPAGRGQTANDRVFWDLAWMPMESFGVLPKEAAKGRHRGPRVPRRRHQTCLATIDDDFSGPQARSITSSVQAREKIPPAIL